MAIHHLTGWGGGNVPDYFMAVTRVAKQSASTPGCFFKVEIDNFFCFNLVLEVDGECSEMAYTICVYSGSL